MKKFFISLFFATFFTVTFPCDQVYVLQKVSCILNHIIRRVEKKPLDFTIIEIENVIVLFESEYKKSCFFCRNHAEFNYLHLVDYLAQHLKRYKNYL